MAGIFAATFVSSAVSAGAPVGYVYRVVLGVDVGSVLELDAPAVGWSDLSVESCTCFLRLQRELLLSYQSCQLFLAHRSCDLNGPVSEHSAG